MSKILDKLTIEQKVALCSGKNEWDTKEFRDSNGDVIIPSVKVADGPHGLRKTVGQGDNLGLAESYPATCFPAESILACSFDRELAKVVGTAIADEARSEGVCTILGPGANIKRNPLCGRNFEYLSEDPYLAGRMAASYIDGVQSRGIGTSLKHFACNSQEYFRMTSDSKMDERTLREIYLSAFEYAIKVAKPATVMCGYNKINGTSCSDNEFLLNHVLREEWGYEGLVVSDWGALNDRIAAFRAGLDLAMPGGSGFEEKDVLDAVAAGKLDEKYIDRSANRVAEFALRQGQLLDDESLNIAYGNKNIMHEWSHKIAQQVAEQSAVLLKNEDCMLPLKDETVCIIGEMAQSFRFQGSGSSNINPTRFTDFLSLMPETKYAPGYDKFGATTDELIAEAVEVAKSSENVVVFAGLPEQYEAEGIDRRTMSLPEGQNKLIEAVAEVNENIVVVLICGCVVEIPWENRVKSILWMGLAGQAGASACLNLLTGKVNPSGKLAETWPMVYEDCPSADTYLMCGKDAEYREGIAVGYRYYDKAGVAVRYPFGHGLSYTRFEYSNMKVEPNGDTFNIEITVKNEGEVAGAEPVLMFVKPPQDGIDRPVRELKGFDKVHLAPGETQIVKFETDARTFAVWNDGWHIYGGEYGISIGGCHVSIDVPGEVFDGIKQSEAFEKSLVQETAGLTAKYDKNSTISEVAGDVLLLRIIYKWFEKKQAKLFGRDSGNYLAAMSSADECPLRAVEQFIGYKNHFAEGIAEFGNRHYIKGIKHLMK